MSDEKNQIAIYKATNVEASNGKIVFSAVIYRGHTDKVGDNPECNMCGEKTTYWHYYDNIDDKYICLHCNDKISDAG